jgi:hypothetical protein
MTVGSNGGICTVCQTELGDNEEMNFYGAPVCVTCWEQLSLGKVSTGTIDIWLKDHIDDTSREAFTGFMGIMAQYPAEFGWNILALSSTIVETIEDPQQRSMLEQSAILSGACIIRNGKKQGEEPDPKLLSLFLVLGQFLVLSIMKKIVLEKGLRTGNILDETLLIGAFNRKMFDMLAGIDPKGDKKLETVLAEVLSKVA